MKEQKTGLKKYLAAARKHIWAILGLIAVALTLWHPAFRGPGAFTLFTATEVPAPTETPEPTGTPAPTSTPAPTAAPEGDPLGLPQLLDPSEDWRLRLVRDEYPLGKDFVPERLTRVDGREQVDGRVAPALKNLIADARAAGYTVYVCSGYRDYATQHIIYFDNHVNIYLAQGMSEEAAHAKAHLSVNYPGCSEHQSGLAVDVLQYNGQPMLPEIGGTGLMAWLEDHCAEYGFVIRYPDGKTDITGVEYEPWHLRYVGVQAAAYIMEHDLCLEQFLGLYGELDLDVDLKLEELRTPASAEDPADGAAAAAAGREETA